ncbi:MAG: acyltransferase [Spirosomataceae bacterium]
MNSGSRICNKVYIQISKFSQVSIGLNFTLSSSGGYNPLGRNIRSSIKVESGAYLQIGDNVGISSTCIWAFKGIKIGNNVKIGADCILMDSDAHSLNHNFRNVGSMDRLNAKKEVIEIGDSVLLGTRCIVLKGVSIGDRSIVGSGSVVTRSIPSDEIWAGNPAKFLKKI